MDRGAMMLQSSSCFGFMWELINEPDPASVRQTKNMLHTAPHYPVLT
jgi:hypothetical protein